MAANITRYGLSPFATAHVFRRALLLAAFALGAILWLGAAGIAEAKTIYVDINGQKSGNGSAENPYRSISQASSHTRPGDTVLVRSGVYQEQVKIKVSGSPAAPITFKAYMDDTVVIEGKKTRKGANLVDITGSNIVFEGFQVKNAKKTGIALWGTKNVVVRKNIVTGSNGSGIWVGHDRRGKSSSNIIEANTVTYNCQMNKSKNRGSGWPPGIAISVSDKSVVRGNRVYENYGEGIGVLSSVGVSVTKNTTYDNFSVNVYLDNAPSTRVISNLIGSTGNRKFFRRNRGPDGVLIANEVTRHPMHSTDIVVTNNTIVGTPDVYYGTYGRNSGLRSSVIGPNKVQMHQKLRLPRGSVGL